MPKITIKDVSTIKEIAKMHFDKAIPYEVRSQGNLQEYLIVCATIDFIKSLGVELDIEIDRSCHNQKIEKL